jgi:hypothetical protein
MTLDSSSVSSNQSDDLQDGVQSTHGQANYAETAPKVFMGQNPALKNWKMFSAGEANEVHKAESDDVQDIDFEKSEPQIGKVKRHSPSLWLQITQTVAVFLTVAWITYVAIYIMSLPNSWKAITTSPLTLGGILASVLAPVAMLWLCISTWQRRSDAHIYAEALRDELRGLFYPNADQSNMIGDDIRALMKQATEMSATSRGAIKAMQRARTGLRSEIRDFAGVSQKAEFHIDRLADSLAKRAEELLTLTEIIEKQTDNISAKAKQGIGEWENVSTEMSELSEEIDGVFTKGNNSLKQAVVTTEESIKSFENTLTLAVGDLSQRVSVVLNSVQSSQSGFVNTVENLEGLNDNLQNRIENLNEKISSLTTVKNTIEGMANVLTTSLDKAELTAQEFIQKSNSIDKKFEDRSSELQSVTLRLLSSVEGLQDVGSLATNKLGEALGMAISGAETISNAVRKSKELLDMSVITATNQIEQTSELAQKTVSTILSDVGVEREKLENVIDDIQLSHIKLMDVSNNIGQQRDDLYSTVETAVDNLLSVSTKLDENSKQPLEFIQNSIDRLEKNAVSIEDKLAIGLVQVNQGGDKLKSVVESMEETIQSSVNTLAIAHENAFVQSHKITSIVRVQNESLLELADRLESQAKIMLDDIESRKTSLESDIEMTTARIASLGIQYVDKSDAVISKAHDVVEKISEYEHSLQQSILSVSAKSDEVSEKIEGVVERVDGQIKNIERLAQVITPETERILSHVARVHSQYSDLKEECWDKVSAIEGNLQKLSQVVSDNVSNLATQATQTSKTLSSSGQSLAVTLANIADISNEAIAKLTSANMTMNGHVQNWSDINQSIQDKADALHNNLGQYAGDLNEVLNISINELEAVTQKYSETADVISAKSDNVTAKLQAVNDRYIEEGHRMSLMAEQSAHKASRIVSTIQEETTKLAEVTKQSLYDLQKSGDVIAVRSREVEEYMKASLSHAKTYCDDLRDQATVLSSSTSDIVDKISEASASLSIKAKEVKKVGQDIVEDIEIVSNKLEQESAVIGRLAKITIETVDDAVGGFSKHGQTLQNTMHELSNQISEIKQTQAKTERDGFIESSKFMVESLYSLAIDVSRHLEGDIDFKVLRAYQRGDVSAYIRHLVDIMPRVPIEKSQRKFIEDGEFRTYVLRFIRQYEELLAQAQLRDYSDMLSNVFSSSDVGKLYKSLCEIAGRSSKEH